MKDDWAEADALVLAVLRQWEGVAKLRHLVAGGVIPQQIAAIFRRGLLTRQRSGWYADPALPQRATHAMVLQFEPDALHRVDVLVGRRLLLEADGAAFHAPEKDRSRDAMLRGLGYLVLHFTDEEIVFGLDDVLDRIEAVLARR